MTKEEALEIIAAIGKVRSRMQGPADQIGLDPVLHDELLEACQRHGIGKRFPVWLYRLD